MKITTSQFRIKELMDYYNDSLSDVSRKTGVQKSALSNYSTKNYGMFLTTVCAFYGNEIRGIQYPQRIKKENYIPTVEDMQKILKEFEGTKFYVPIFLGCRGLRLSEVCALTLDDLSGNVLTINKAKVKALGTYETKTTKTVDSSRKIVIPDRIASLIREQRLIYHRIALLWFDDSPTGKDVR